MIKNKKLWFGLVLIAILVVAYAIQFTSLAKFYSVNLFSSIVLSNTVNLLFIAILLVVISYLEMKIKRMKKEREGK